MEHLTLHRGAVDDATLCRAQAIESSGKQRADCERQGELVDRPNDLHAVSVDAEMPSVDQHRRQLLEKERVAAGSGDDPIRGLSRDRRAQICGEQCAAVLRP